MYTLILSPVLLCVYTLVHIHITYNKLQTFKFTESWLLTPINKKHCGSELLKEFIHMDTAYCGLFNE